MGEGPFRLADGIEVVRVSEERFMLRSDYLALEMSGEAAALFAERVLTRLRQPHRLDDVLRLLPGFSPASVAGELERLVAEGVLVRDAAVDVGERSGFANLLAGMRFDAQQVLGDLGRRRVAVFGLEAHGALVAEVLARAGVGELVLVDPFPASGGGAASNGDAGGGRRAAASGGGAREDGVAAALAGMGTGTKVTTAGATELSRERVSEIARDCDLLIGTFDRGFSAAQHWINRAAFETDTPALFGEVRAATSFAGPLVMPGASACWMCYRMRSLAAEADFELAMAYEEHLDGQRAPRAEARGFLPGVPELLASLLGLEAVRLLAGVAPPTLVDQVVEHDAFTGASATHAVVPKPDCPVCGKKNPERDLPTLAELARDAGVPGDLAALRERLVSRRTGVVTELQAVKKDVGEPAKPYVWRAKVSNHRFLADHADEHAVCSGKGMSVLAAQVSCLGEAVERYSGAYWQPSELTYARADDLPGTVLDPSRLVLYLPEQYETLRYAPYSRSSRLGWMRARSLTTDDEVWVPAIAALMDYAVASHEELLFPPTSNGLAAGPSLAAAVLGAVYEVLERDAFLIAWLNRLPGRAYPALEHPDEDVRDLAAAYVRRGVRLELVRVPTDHPVTVFVGLALQEEGEGPAATVGLGADLDPVAAARQAAIEVAQVRPGLRQSCRGAAAERMRELAADPLGVATLDDHALLYAHPSTRGELDFLFGDAGSWPEATRPRADPVEDLALLVDGFRSVDQDVLYVNLTPPDMAALGLHTARALLPGFQPIWFGRGERRLAGERLYRLPHALGLAPAPSTPATLNPMPHPVA